VSWTEPCRLGTSLGRGGTWRLGKVDLDLSPSWQLPTQQLQTPRPRKGRWKRDRPKITMCAPSVLSYALRCEASRSTSKACCSSWNLSTARHSRLQSRARCGAGDKLQTDLTHENCRSCRGEALGPGAGNFCGRPPSERLVRGAERHKGPFGAASAGHKCASICGLAPR
jgi:hypothetical protein